MLRHPETCVLQLEAYGLDCTELQLPSVESADFATATPCGLLDNCKHAMLRFIFLLCFPFRHFSVEFEIAKFVRIPLGSNFRTQLQPHAVASINAHAATAETSKDVELKQLQFAARIGAKKQ
jgi:hypothetical protein